MSIKKFASLTAGIILCFGFTLSDDTPTSGTIRIDCYDCRQVGLPPFVQHMFPGSTNNPLYENFWANEYHEEYAPLDCYGSEECDEHVNCDPQEEEEDAEQLLLAGKFTPENLRKYVQEHNGTLTYNSSRRAIQRLSSCGDTPFVLVHISLSAEEDEMLMQVFN